MASEQAFFSRGSLNEELDRFRDLRPTPLQKEGFVQLSWLRPRLTTASRQRLIAYIAQCSASASSRG